MIKDHEISCTTTFYYNGKVANLSGGTRTLRLVEFYREVRYTLRYYPFDITRVSSDMVVIVKYPTATSHTEIVVDVDGERKRVRAEKEVMTFRGDPEDMKVILEYLYWFFRSEAVNPIPAEVFSESNLGGPSALPQFAALEEIGIFQTMTETAVLEYYGLTADEVKYLTRPNRFRDGPRWIDIAVANEIWLEEGPGRSFSEVLREHGLLPACAAA